ncbi:MAG: hypothetical protein ABIO70_19240 [Pseudomonadota bacterium]
MTPSQTASLDQLRVPPELRERAKMLWGLTALGGAWGWVICNFVWKVPGQEDDPWFQGQLKQAMVVGVAGWLGYGLCGFGWLVHVGLGAFGFLTIGKGEDYIAPVVGGFVLGKKEEAIEELPAQPAAAHATAQPQAAPAAALDPIEGVSLQVWAWAQAHIDMGHPMEAIVSQVQIDPERWKRVTAQWLVRRAMDRSGLVQAEYEKYRPAQAQQAQAQQAQAARAQAQPAGVQPARVQVSAQPVAAQPAAAVAVGREPITVERWVEISVALEVGEQRGWDRGQLMANFGMAPSEWAAATAWWSQAYGQRSQEPAFSARYQQLQQYYRQYYQGR